MDLNKPDLQEIKNEINQQLSQYHEIMLQQAAETRKISVNMIHQQKQRISANVPRYNLIMTICSVYTMIQLMTFLIWQYNPQTVKQLLSVLFLGKTLDALIYIIQ